MEEDENVDVHLKRALSMLLSDMQRRNISGICVARLQSGGHVSASSPKEMNPLLVCCMIYDDCVAIDSEPHTSLLQHAHAHARTKSLRLCRCPCHIKIWLNTFNPDSYFCCIYRDQRRTESNAVQNAIPIAYLLWLAAVRKWNKVGSLLCGSYSSWKIVANHNLWARSWLIDWLRNGRQQESNIKNTEN